MWGCTNKYTVAEKNVEDEVIENSNSIAFKLGKDFFIKKNVDVELLKKSYIVNQNHFQSIFGFDHAKNSVMIPIDFNKEFVIPIILDMTNVASKIEVEDVQVLNNEILIKYTVNQLYKLSYLIQPNELIILEKNRIRDLSKMKLKFNRTTNIL